MGAAEERSADTVTWHDIFGRDVDRPSNTVAGQMITDTSALQISAVYASIRILSDGVSTLPLGVYKPKGKQRIEAKPAPDWSKFEAGPYTKIDVVSQTMVSLLLQGNAYIATYRDGDGRVQYLEVLDPFAVTPKLVGATVVYDIIGVSGAKSQLTKYDILHIRGMTMPGQLEGLSPVAYARETLGLSKAATEFGGAFFGNGGFPGLVAEVPGTLSPTAQTTLKRNWQDLHGGSGNAHALAVLTEGTKLSKITIAPNDAQFLETRQFQVNEVARLYGVPTSLLQQADGPEMGQSIQDKNTHFVQHSLRPWVERIEAAFSWLVVSEGRFPNGFVKLNLDGLLRGNHETRYATYVSAATSGILTINEIRAMEDLEPVEWGDTPISVQVQSKTDEPAEAAPVAAVPDPAVDPVEVEDEQE